MIIWIRNIVVIFVLLSITYVILSAWAALKQRVKLEADFKDTDTSHDNAVSKKEYIEKGMQKYNRSLKPKLIFGVFLVPIAIMAVLIYLAQYT